jgi:hypothetical protein
MDSILACYKDGTNGTRNFRYFGVVYHLALLFCIGSFVITKDTFILGCITFACILVGMLVAVARPYKSNIYNTVDVFQILSVGLGFSGGITFLLAVTPLEKTGSRVMFVPFTLPLLYLVASVCKANRLLFHYRNKIRLHFANVQMYRQPLVFPCNPQN